MRSLSKKEGVTLVELILVFVILATAAAMAIPNLQKGMEKKRADNAIATLRKISYCIRLYKQENGGTLPAGAQFKALETTTGNGCLDRSQYEPSYNFVTYLGSDQLITTVLQAEEATSGRVVLLEPAGTLDRSGDVYDFPSAAAAAARTNWYGKSKE